MDTSSHEGCICHSPNIYDGYTFGSTSRMVIGLNEAIILLWNETLDLHILIYHTTRTLANSNIRWNCINIEANSTFNILSEI